MQGETSRFVVGLRRTFEDVQSKNKKAPKRQRNIYSNMCPALVTAIRLSSVANVGDVFDEWREDQGIPTRLQAPNPRFDISADPCPAHVACFRILTVCGQNTFPVPASAYRFMSISVLGLCTCFLLIIFVVANRFLCCATLRVSRDLLSRNSGICSYVFVHRYPRTRSILYQPELVTIV